MAHYEVEWWKAHHRGERSQLIVNMIRLYELQFEISYSQASSAVGFRVEAAREHDIAEEFEDNGHQSKADMHWKKAESLLEKHFEILNAVQQSLKP